MKNRQRRILCTALCAAMLLTSLPFAEVSAADSKTSSQESKETVSLKAAISEVKKRIDIPKELTKFDYETETSYDTTYYKLVWYSEKENSYGEMYTDKSVTVEYFNGFISAYSYVDKNRPSSSSLSFAKLTPEEQDKYVRKYLKMLNPELKGNIVIERDSAKLSLDQKEVRYSFSREESGIEFNGNSGSMCIDRDTGELLGYELTWWNDAECPDASKRLSEQKVMDIYASRKPLGVRYSLFNDPEYDEETKKWIYNKYILPVYYPTVDGENEIDAITGKYTAYYDDKKKYSYTDAYSWDSYDEYDYEPDVWAGEGVDGEGEVLEDFSEAELEALEKENKYISAEQALKIIKDNKYINFNKELILSTSYLDSYTDDKGELKHTKDFIYEYTTEDETKDSIYLRVTMDAFSGDIISFYKRYDYGEESPNNNIKPVSKSAAVPLAEEAAEYFIGDKAKEYREESFWFDDPKEEDKRKAVRFTRYVNDIPTDFDKITVTVDSRGEVLGFSHTYHDMEFPEAKLVSEKQAYEKLFQDMKPDLFYRGFTDLQMKSHVYLTYKFESDYLLNALTGERITYDGEAYYTSNDVKTEVKKAALYTDIKGHKYEKEIETLWNYGVRITDNEKLDPDGEITIEEFQELLSSGLLYYDYLHDMYPKPVKKDPKTGDYYYEDNPKLKEKLTYGELARLYVYIYTDDCYGAGEIKGIFASPYKNIPASDPYCGYIAIAKSKGLISDGASFGKDKTISRAEALKIVYDYIAAEKKLKLYEIFKI
ncbi:MAG: YcdB/YcdC domain-containing protein [Huintestinicola sp.]|uniref:YcdB/YcdC domain-containing protein n=1 Tax=Huintestinicola sp. TaxID=2981661 RepID=UPI003F0CB830